MKVYAAKSDKTGMFWHGESGGFWAEPENLLESAVKGAFCLYEDMDDLARDLDKSTREDYTVLEFELDLKPVLK